MSVSSPHPYRADLALAARCMEGDRAAQRELFAKYRAPIHGAVFRILGSNVGIEDAIQDTYVEVFRSLRGYRGEAALGTWIHMCAIRVGYGYLSKRARVLPVESEPVLTASPDDVADARSAVTRLYRLLEELTPGTRIAFVLSAIEGRSNREVAQLMGATELATKVRVWRARRQVETLAAADPVLAPYVGTESGKEEPT